jgi:hypothetical protein
MMNPRLRAALQALFLLVILIAIFLLFPIMFAFVEMAAKELRYLWWLILLLALSIWLIWGLGRKPKK